jgi:hypothetical protein
MKPYYLHTRKGIWYVEFTDVRNNTRYSAKSLKTKDKIIAIGKAEDYLKNGFPISTMYKQSVRVNIAEYKNKWLNDCIKNIKTGNISSIQIADILNAITENSLNYSYNEEFLESAINFLLKTIEHIKENETAKQYCRNYFRNIGLPADSIDKKHFTLKMQHIALKRRIKTERKALNETANY